MAQSRNQSPVKAADIGQMTVTASAEVWAAFRAALTDAGIVIGAESARSGRDGGDSMYIRCSFVMHTC